MHENKNVSETPPSFWFSDQGATIGSRFKQNQWGNLESENSSRMKNRNKELELHRVWGGRKLPQENDEKRINERFVLVVIHSGSQEVSRFSGLFQDETRSKQALLNRLDDATQELVSVFEDWDRRLSCTLKIEKVLSDFEKELRQNPNKFFRWTVNNLHDAIRFNYAEDLTMAQVDAFRNVVLMLKKGEQPTSSEEYRRIRRSLRDASLSLLPVDDKNEQSSSELSSND
jgi:hypothetical protein